MFLVVILSCASIAFVFVDATMLKGNSLAGVFPIYVRVLQFSAMFLLWTVILNWQVPAAYSRRWEDDEDQDDDNAGGEVKHRRHHVTRKDSFR